MVAFLRVWSVLFASSSSSFSWTSFSGTTRLAGDDNVVGRLLSSVGAEDKVDFASAAESIYNDARSAYGRHVVKASDTITFTSVDDNDYDENATDENDFDAKLKPTVLLLPGLDGVGASSSAQYAELARNFEVWRLVIDPVYDRTSFTGLVDAVDKFLTSHYERTQKKTLLIGESFGGLLAPAVALRMPHLVEGLVLVNPATSFDRTAWWTVGPLLTSLRHVPKLPFGNDDDDNRRLPTIYSVLGGMALAATVPDSNQFGRIVQQIIDSIPETDAASQLDSIRRGFLTLENSLPAATLEHRITQWLQVGSAVVSGKETLKRLTMRTLVVVGTEDRMLPSADEGRRLGSVLPNCTVIELREHGHAALDDRTNLTELILTEGNFFESPNKDLKKYDPILDWKPPSPEVVEDTLERQIRPLRRFTSPIFFSTDRNGKRHLGLSRIPPSHKDGQGPLLFVANHQLLGFDLGLILAQLIEDRGMFVRGLAHPVIFQGANLTSGNTNNNKNDRRTGRGGPGQNDQFKTFGAVQVSPRNLYRMMETGQPTLLFPGGVREVFHRRGEEYQLFWPEDGSDFVRVAARFNATVVPLSALGCAESLNILADNVDLLKLPFGLGDRVAASSAAVMSARASSEEDEIFVPPLVAPGMPARQYFVFGRPMSTSDLDHRDREACAVFYHDVQNEMKRGFDDVIRARTRDPYGDTPLRVLTETVASSLSGGVGGSTKKAPTFPVEELNAR